MGRRRRLVAIVAACASAASTVACATIAGLDEPSEPAIVAPSRDAQTDSFASRDRAEPDGDDSALPCAPGDLVAEDNTLIIAERATAAPTIDGDGSDWRCVDRMRFENGGVASDIPATATAEIAMQWDEAHLYAWARVRTVEPAGDDGTLIHRNDSFSVYVTAPSPGVDFRANDHRLVFDGAQHVVEYAGNAPRNGGIAEGVSGVAGASTAEGTVRIFEIEARIAAAATGRTAFAAGDEIRVSFQINDRSAQGVLGYRLWYFASGATCLCGGNPGGPSCNLQCTGKVTLK